MSTVTWSRICLRNNGRLNSTAFVVIIVALLAIPTTWLIRRQRLLSDALSDELTFARNVGLPTTFAEFKSYLHPVTPMENAAPLYAQLTDVRSAQWHKSPTLLAQEITFGNGKNVMPIAIDLLTKNRANLSLIDEASSRSGCSFDRDWEMGAAMLSPWLARMKHVAGLLMVRGAIAAKRGDAQGAISDVRTALHMAGHLRQTPYYLDHAVASAIEYLPLRTLADWTFAYPGHQEYSAELRAVLERLPPPNLKDMNRFTLVEALSTIDLCKTEEGRKLIGLKPQDIPPGEGVISKLQAPQVGRMRVVKGHRMLFESFVLPRAQRVEAQEAAKSEIYQGLVSFPTAAVVYESLVDSDAALEGDPVARFATRIALFTAFLRAQKAFRERSKLDLHDLRSAFDGTPVRYQSTQSGFKLEVNAPNFMSKVQVLEFPPLKKS